MKKYFLFIFLILALLHVSEVHAVANCTTVTSAGDLLTTFSQGIRKGFDVADGSTSQVNGQGYLLNTTFTMNKIINVSGGFKCIGAGTASHAIVIYNGTSGYKPTSAAFWGGTNLTSITCTGTETQNVTFVANETGSRAINITDALELSFVMGSTSSSSIGLMQSGGSLATYTGAYKVEDPGNVWTSVGTDWAFFTVCYDDGNTTTVGAVSINEATYNFSSGLTAADQILWRTNTSVRANTTDDTPTVKFNITNGPSVCAISVYNLNYTQMLSNGSYYNSSEGNASGVHTVTWGTSLAYGNHNLYISCAGSNISTSTSGALPIFVDATRSFSFVNPTPANNTRNFQSTNYTINTTSTGYGGTVTHQHNLYNSSGTLIRQNNGTQANLTSTFTNIGVGKYYINATITNTTFTAATETRQVYVYNITNGSITVPSAGATVYNPTLNVTILAFSILPSDAPVSLSNYNVTLLNADGSLNRTLNTTLGLNTSFTINIEATDLRSNNYIIRWYAFDNTSNYTYLDRNFTYVNNLSSIQLQKFFPVPASAINFTKNDTYNFTTQVINASNISAYGQDNNTACYAFNTTNTGNVAIYATANYTDNYYIFLTIGKNNLSAEKTYLNATRRNIANLTITQAFANSETIKLEYNMTRYLQNQNVISLNLTNSSGTLLNSSYYTLDTATGAITLNASGNYTVEATKTADLTRIKTNVSVPLDHRNIKQNSFTLYNGTHTIGSGNYTLNLTGGRITGLASWLKNTAVYANYTYYQNQTFYANYTHYNSTTVEIGCFGNYRNAVLNDTYNGSIQFILEDV